MHSVSFLEPGGDPPLSTKQNLRTCCALPRCSAFAAASASVVTSPCSASPPRASTARVTGLCTVQTGHSSLMLYTEHRTLSIAATHACCCWTNSTSSRAWASHSLFSMPSYCRRCRRIAHFFRPQRSCVAIHGDGATKAHNPMAATSSPGRRARTTQI